MGLRLLTSTWRIRAGVGWLICGVDSMSGQVYFLSWNEGLNIENYIPKAIFRMDWSVQGERSRPSCSGAIENGER